MIRIRRFEDKCYELYTQEKIRGFLHLYDGEEAVAVGISAALEPRDRVVSTYREHGHALARGMSMESALAEMYGKATGCAGGRGGSMHLFDAETNLYGGNAIVGGGLPLAVGLGLGDRMQGQDRITVCFFGDGALAEGEFHEAMNLAALWQLPVLFVLENNLYAMGTAVARVQANTDFTGRAATYGMPAECVDGNRTGDIGSAIQEHAEANGYGVVRELVGHGLGRKLHEPPEVPNYGRRGHGPLLQEGMVLAIEPMINMGTHLVRQLEDGWTIVTRDGRPSAHYEHNVAVRKGRAEVLSTFSYIEDVLKEVNV
jgi:hypothetical protein